MSVSSSAAAARHRRDGGTLRVALAQLGAHSSGERLRAGARSAPRKSGKAYPRIARQIERPTALCDGQTIGDSIGTSL